MKLDGILVALLLAGRSCPSEGGEKKVAGVRRGTSEYPPVKVMMMGDPQFSNDAATRANVVAAMDDIVTLDYEFMAVLGDLVQHDAAYFDDYLDLVVNRSARPVYSLAGNGDMTLEEGGTVTRHGMGLAAYRKWIPDPLWYTVYRRGIRFVFLSTMDVTGDGDHICILGNEQMAWLRGELTRDTNATTVIFTHAPIKNTTWGSGEDHSMARWLDESDEMCALFAKYPNIKVYAHGHMHLTYGSVDSSGRGGYCKEGNVLHVSVGAAQRNRGSSMLHVEKDRITVKVRDHENGQWRADFECRHDVKTTLKPVAKVKGFTLWQLPSQVLSDHYPTIGNKQMMSYVIQTAKGRLIVVDGGNTGDGTFLKNFLIERGDRVDSWFVTHPHPDHVDALTWILENRKGLAIEKIYASFPPDDWIAENYDPNAKGSHRAFAKAMAEAGRKHIDLDVGDVLDVDGIQIEVLYTGNTNIASNAANNYSMVMRFSDPTKSVLFTGDLGPLGGDDVLASVEHGKLKADYVQMPHHGNQCAKSNFYAVVSADYALWPTPVWLWNNAHNGGYDSGPYTTLNTRQWMDALGVKSNYVSGVSGLIEIR